MCALVGCILMGPRIGRFDKDGRAVKMPGHSVPLSALGGLILVFGFFACNGTKQVRSFSPQPSHREMKFHQLVTLLRDNPSVLHVVWVARNT